MLNPGDRIVISVPVSFHLNAPCLTLFYILQIVVDACAIFIVSRLVFSVCISAWINLRRSAPRKRKRAQRDNDF